MEEKLGLISKTILVVGQNHHSTNYKSGLISKKTEKGGFFSGFSRQVETSGYAARVR